MLDGTLWSIPRDYRWGVAREIVERRAATSDNVESTQADRANVTVDNLYERAAPGGQDDIEEAQADRADNSDENLLDKLADVLTVLLLDVWSVSGFRCVTEQAKLDWEKD